MAGVEQDDVSLAKVQAVLRERRLEIGDGDPRPRRELREVEADRLAAEKLERHLVDRGRVRVGVEVCEGVDVGGRMVGEDHQVGTV